MMANKQKKDAEPARVEEEDVGEEDSDEEPQRPTKQSRMMSDAPPPVSFISVSASVCVPSQCPFLNVTP